MKKRYRVHGCFQRYDEQEGEIVTAPCDYFPHEKIEPEFWGVFEVKEDGVEAWIADFRDRDDAEMFALDKGQEEVK
jgi:hypothetical protein